MPGKLPFVAVSNLPPSASFYSAVTHPLGLRYISASSSSIVFGDITAPSSPVPVFEVKVAAAGSEAPRPTRIVFSAASLSVVKSFHAAALRANPDLLEKSSGEDNDFAYSFLSPDSSSAKITDLDGNMMEVVYINTPDYPSNYEGKTVRQTQSTNDEVSRILDWNLEVATSQPARSVAGSAAPKGDNRTVVSRHSSRPMEGEGQVIHRKTTTTSTTHYAPVPETKEAEGYGTGTLIGSVLGGIAVGAAVGGALTYCMMKNEQNRAPRQDFDAPALQRRSTYPHPSQAGRDIEVNAADSKKYPPISGSRYAPSVARSRAMEDIEDDRRSHYTTGSRARRRSEVSASRQPLLIADTEHRSVAGSQYSAGGPKLLMDHAYRSEVGSVHSEGPEVVADPAWLSVAPSRRSVAPSEDGLFKPVDYNSRAPSRAPSHAGTKVNAAPSRHSAAPSRRSSVSRRHDYDDERRSHAGSRAPRPAEVETFVSARSDRSASTVRPAEPRRMYSGEHGATMDFNVGNILVNEFTRARGAPHGFPKTDRRQSGDDRNSRVSAATAVKVPVRSRAPSQATAREPVNPIMDSQSVWEDDGRSVMPDDSISCIGSRKSRR